MIEHLDERVQDEEFDGFEACSDIENSRPYIWPDGNPYINSVYLPEAGANRIITRPELDLVLSRQVDEFMGMAGEQGPVQFDRAESSGEPKVFYGALLPRQGLALEKNVLSEICEGPVAVCMAGHFYKAKVCAATMFSQNTLSDGSVPCAFVLDSPVYPVAGEDKFGLAFFPVEEDKDILYQLFSRDVVILLRDEEREVASLEKWEESIYADAATNTAKALTDNICPDSERGDA